MVAALEPTGDPRLARALHWSRRLSVPTRDEPTFAELKRYVRFSEADVHALRAIGPSLAPAFPRLAREFYDRIREHEGAHAVFTSEEQIEQLQRSLVAWLERVFGGTYDAAYFAKTEQIGRAHVRVGLPQRYVIAAMSVMRSSLSALVEERATREALARLLDIELALMLDAHHAHALERAARAAAPNESTTAAQLEAIDLAPVLVVGLDRAGAILLFNRAAERATGWARDELMGRSFADVFLPEGERAAIAPRLLASGMVEAPLQTRPGKLRTIRWRIAERDAAGAVYAFGADVTDEQEEREQEARRLRLAAAGTLVAGLAHEIRNPLNGASLHLAFLERALTRHGTAETIDAVRTVGTELRRLSTLVTDFLEFARPKPLVIAPVRARFACENALRAMSERAAEAHVTLNADYPTHDVVLAADVSRLEHVVGHLLENAIDALRPGGGGEVTVRVRRDPREGFIDVEDNGPGLSEPGAPIFDAFYSTKPDGAGLGLAIVQRVVADHHGTVEVDRRAGITRFRVRLPLSEPRDET